MRIASPISKVEFLQMFQRCVPPVGWSPKLAIANSGGPDSTCLLFLMHCLLSDETTIGKGLPTSVVSLTVDHTLQSSSSSMANRCSKNASSLNIEHITVPIPWSEPPFPPRPSDKGAFENIARDARFHVLFELMKRMGIKTLAFGHHADDQVETSLMRLAKGTTEIGAGGMRPCRRWGMGLGRSSENELGWAGYEGMNRWIVRPLLEVSKERILATCEANELEYVTDVTNFQPELTLRNAIRQMLKEEEAIGRGTLLNHSPTMERVPPDMKEQLEKMKEATERLRSVHYDISGGTEQLRGSVKVLSSHVTDINDEVDRHLMRRTVPSPIGTFFLSSHNLSAIHDDSVRSMMVLRIMRYVSFQPWGSVRADGNRRKSSIQQIVDKIWTPDPRSANIRHFTAGGGVLWSPGVIRGDLTHHRDATRCPDLRIDTIDLAAGDRFGWLASRQPPFHKNTRAKGHGSNPLTIDLTDQLRQAGKEVAQNHEATKTLEILYDCRFLLRFDVTRMPPEIGVSLAVGRSQILVRPRTRWYQPEVVWQVPGRTVVLAHISDESQVGGEPLHISSKGGLLDWIRMYWIRTLDAT